MIKKLFVGLNLGLVFFPGPTLAKEVLLSKGEKTEWRYLDDGSAPVANWADPKFDDGKWKAGKAPLGYGEPNLGTKVSYGEDSANKHLTTYFRTTFEVGKKAELEFEKVVVALQRDDGAAVYLNGKEVLRSNLEEGKLSSKTAATRSIGNADEAEWHRVELAADSLRYEAVNTVAVEVHQSTPGSSDLFLDLEITGLVKGDLPARDFYREGIAALRQGNYEEGAKLIAQMPEDHPEYAGIMAAVGWQVYGEALGRAKEGLPFVKKAYEAAPTDRQVVRAYIKTHILSGVLFKEETLKRERSKTVAPEHKFLVTKPDLGLSPTLSRKELEEDLDYLEQVMVTCFSYLEFKGVDYQAAFDAIRASLDDETPVNRFQLQIEKLISLFCDGHAGLAVSSSSYFPEGYAPYAAGSSGGRVFLYNPGEGEFLDKDHPYVKSIDGRPFKDWLKVASYTVVKESPQWRLRQSLRNLTFVNYIRAELGLPKKDMITLELESEDKKQTRKLDVKVAGRPARSLPFPTGDSRRIGEVGYIRLPQMTGSSQFLDDLNEYMGDFKDTKGLVIDVRGNPGGSKNILLTLMPYFLKPGDPMRIIEFSAYRKPMEVPKPMPGGFNMSSMSAQPVTSPHWKTEAERKYVGDAIKAFKPLWQPPVDKFSPFYVLAFDSTMNPKAYYYDKPLIILQDSGSFSSADIFLGGFKGLANTTLIGTTSGGSNGWRDVYTLPNSEIPISLSQTAKFRPTGEPFDSLGVPPDVVMEATPADLLGKSDSVLDAAVKRLSK
ncbi:MAG: S41 family peptidase [Akkermansiaceae bacterium]